MAARNTLRRSLLYGKLKLPSKAASSPHFTPRAPKKSIQANKQHQTVPGSSQRFLDKSRSLTADCVTYDLEDSVTPHMKAEARSLVRRAIDQAAPPGIRERAVRINSVDSGLALGDLSEVVSGLLKHTYSVQLTDHPSSNPQT
jgi:Citrate lyase beta subunit